MTEINYNQDFPADEAKAFKTLLVAFIGEYNARDVKANYLNMLILEHWLRVALACKDLPAAIIAKTAKYALPGLNKFVKLPVIGNGLANKGIEVIIDHYVQLLLKSSVQDAFRVSCVEVARKGCISELYGVEYGTIPRWVNDPVTNPLDLANPTGDMVDWVIDLSGIN